MTDGTKREDDTLSGGSELITLCLGLIHKSIVQNELALRRNVNLRGSLTVSVALRLLTLHLKKDKDVLCLVTPQLEIKTRSRLEEKEMNHQAGLFISTSNQQVGGNKRIFLL